MKKLKSFFNKFTIPTSYLVPAVAFFLIVLVVQQCGPEEWNEWRKRNTKMAYRMILPPNDTTKKDTFDFDVFPEDTTRTTLDSLGKEVFVIHRDSVAVNSNCDRKLKE